MIEFWLDVHLSPAIARWIRDAFPDCSARAARDLGLEYSLDVRIFDAAADANAVVITKDRDFVRLAAERSPAPRVVHLTCGNTTTARLQQILAATLPRILAHFAEGGRVVEVFDEQSLW